jgi:dienelactone hydrolase
VPCLLVLLYAAQIPAADTLLPSPSAGPYPVGYRVSYLNDPTRSFGPRLALDGSALPRPLSRPIQVHVWYPAANTDGRALIYEDYVVAADGPVQEEPDAAGARAERLNAYRSRPLQRGATEARLDAILGQRMRARLDAPPATGRYPLILYAPSINADPYENVMMFEYLASFGYVVAAAPSMGLQEAEVSRDRAGARAQIGDLAFVLGFACGEPCVDQEHMGVLGFSWGGMTGLLFAIPHLGVDAVACLDGASTMAEYRSIAESFDWWVSRDLRGALLDIVLAEKERDLRFGAEALYADAYAWSLPGISHQDFSADAVAKYRVAADDSLAVAAAESWKAVADQVRLFFDAYLNGDARALGILRSPSAPLEGSTWTFREALPLPPTAEQFDEVIETQGVGAAVALFHELRARDPGVVVFDEKRLLRYANLWGPERSEDLLVLLTLNLEAYPGSADTRFWLGQVNLALGDQEAAVRALEETIAIDPGNAKARQLLDRLR